MAIRIQNSDFERKFLFLDFDGVVSCGFGRQFEKAPLVSEWLRRRPHVQVIISSAWREFENLHELRSHFDEDVRSQIIDTTPISKISSFCILESARKSEVEEWLTTYGQSKLSIPYKYAVLDDLSIWFPDDYAPLVLCNTNIGVTEHELGLVDELLETEGGDVI